MPYAVAVDIGGTFTDLVAYDHDGHRVVYSKSPTTYGNFVAGILDLLEPHRMAGYCTHLLALGEPRTRGSSPASADAAPIGRA